MAMTRKLGCMMLAGAMLMAMAAPADARRGRHWERDDNIDAGDILGAAVVIGGIAAIASAIKGSDGRGGSYATERRAIDACVREAERGYSRYDITRVRDITQVDREGSYYFVRGTLETRSGYDGGGDDYYADEVRTDGFTCTARSGRIYDFQRSSGYR